MVEERYVRVGVEESPAEDIRHRWVYVEISGPRAECGCPEGSTPLCNFLVKVEKR